ncbi:MAG: hypothetical protein R2716_03595 [Microthrixaceae bacterium]
MSGVIRCSASHEPTAAEVVRCAEERALLGFPLRRFARFSRSRSPRPPRELPLVVGDVPRGTHRDPPATAQQAGDLLGGRHRARRHAGTAAARAWPRWGGRADPSGIIWLVDGRGWGLETVLHEMAHLAAGAEAGHGDAFVDSLCGLWRHEAGVEPWAALSAAFSSCELRDAAARRVPSATAAPLITGVVSAL